MYCAMYKNDRRARFPLVIFVGSSRGIVIIGKKKKRKQVRNTAQVDFFCFSFEQTLDLWNSNNSGAKKNEGSVTYVHKTCEAAR